MIIYFTFLIYTYELYNSLKRTNIYTLDPQSYLYNEYNLQGDPSVEI